MAPWHPHERPRTPYWPVGGRLRRLLESRGVPLRCLSRNIAGLASRVPSGTELVQADVLQPETLGPALEGGETTGEVSGMSILAA